MKTLNIVQLVLFGAALVLIPMFLLTDIWVLGMLGYVSLGLGSTAILYSIFREKARRKCPE